MGSIQPEPQISFILKEGPSWSLFGCVFTEGCNEKVNSTFWLWMKSIQDGFNLFEMMCSA